MHRVHASFIIHNAQRNMCAKQVGICSGCSHGLLSQIQTAHATCILKNAYVVLFLFQRSASRKIRSVCLCHYAYSYIDTDKMRRLMASLGKSVFFFSLLNSVLPLNAKKCISACEWARTQQYLGKTVCSIIPFCLALVFMQTERGFMILKNIRRSSSSHLQHGEECRQD